MNGELPALRFLEGCAASGIVATSGGNPFEFAANFATPDRVRAVLISAIHITNGGVRGMAVAFRVQNSASAPAGGVDDLFQLPIGQHMVVRTDGASHIYFARNAGSLADLGMSVQGVVMPDEDAPTIERSTLYENIDADTEHAIPTLPDGSNPREILISGVSADYGDAFSFLLCEGSDPAAASTFSRLPCGRIVRLSSAGFSHIRLAKPAGQTALPDVTISPIK